MSLINYKVLKNDGNIIRIAIDGIVVELTETIAKSKKFLDAIAMAILYSRRSRLLSITGESGTGKEHIFKAIAKASKSNKVVSTNCGAINENLLESELFGHKKGSFTDAVSDRKGVFLEVADGILFLDEIGEMSLRAQVKLLRAIEYFEIKPVGSDRVFKHNAQVVIATNRDLLQFVQEGKFRRDLYYRIEGFNISIPPLRERPEDIDAILDYSFGHLYSFSSGTREALLEYSWPGNIRELKNAIERAKLKSNYGEKPLSWEMFNIREIAEDKLDNYFKENLSLSEMEKLIILKTLKKTSFNVKKTCEILGIPRSTFYNRIKKHNIDLER